MTVGKILAALVVGLGFFMAIGVAPATPVVVGIGLVAIGLAVIIG